MGLLDDAIREHLELKRRHGADPGEIAHEERAALEPVLPDEAGADDGAEPPAEDAPAATGEIGSAADAGALEDFSQAGQETAELDMSTVLDDDAERTVGPGEIVAAPPRRRGEDAVESAGAESFEWEASGPQGEQLPGDVPGQERLSLE